MRIHAIKSSYSGSGSDSSIDTSTTNYHALACSAFGDVDATIQVDSSSNGTTWIAGGIIPAQSVTSASGTLSILASINANYARVTIPSFTGDGVIQSSYCGYDELPNFNSGTIVLEKLTSGGTNGTIIAQGGKIISFVNPT